MSRLMLLGMVLCLGACGAIRPDHGDGAADLAATDGGLSGGAEGNLGNAGNVGSDNSVVRSSSHFRSRRPPTNF